MKNEFSNYSSILTYDENGYVDYTRILDEYDEANEIATQEAGVLLMDNLQDQTGRTGYALAGWRPRKNDMKAQAVEWWNWGMSLSNPTFFELTVLQTGKMHTASKRARSSSASRAVI